MSDFGDVLYDPSVHTHTSCVDEVAGCDAVLLIVGSRFGGKAVPEAVSAVDLEALAVESSSIAALRDKGSLSVTQLEILKAVEQGVPVITFVDCRVWSDHAVYEKNKGSSILSDIQFPSVDKQETAHFIFNFVDYLRHRTRGNSLFPFAKVQDIEDILRKQWASLLQRLLSEQRRRDEESRRIDEMADQLENLKTAILTSIGTSKEREVARGVVKYRRLVDFLRSLGVHDDQFVLAEFHSWSELLSHAGIVSIQSLDDLPGHEQNARFLGHRARSYLVKDDGSYYEQRYGRELLHTLEKDWGAFTGLDQPTKEIIIDALTDLSVGQQLLRHHTEPFEMFLDDLARKRENRAKMDSDDESSAP